MKYFWRPRNRARLGIDRMVTAAMPMPKRLDLGLGADHRREHGDADRQGLHALLEGHQQRPQEVVPVQGEDDHGRGDGRRPRERKGDPPEDLEPSGAVDQGRILELAREGQEELAKDVDAEDVGDHRQDQRLVGVGPADLDHRDQHRHHGDLGGDHQRGEEDQEDQVAAREAQTRQRVARHRAGQHAERGRKARLDDAVQGPLDHRVLEHLDVVVEDDGARKPLDLLGHHLGGRLERGADHPDERRRPKAHDQHAQEPDRHVGDPQPRAGNAPAEHLAQRGAVSHGPAPG